ncbi:MAG: tRNA dihydrouridine synthase DusB [Gammaproteobacteria bacterium]|nr:tRNA dihydrouridine synthase DusB [Gammaproteobacteria bacterium]MBT8095312.1 tRNA dihydrouridine synthase DusB [Gammaproteobacteria bacterium]NNF49464.1 tRNA dihydrouridine synthase DusB [Woeseiaceae bacterium]NNL63343.1 tRNA dihydrouridine synthase DusB [Woeseiaceae bacterium]
MRIGPYELGSPFVLAPMAGITDAPFRRLCRAFGAGMTTSEMTTADTSLWQTPKSRHRLDLDLDAEPVTVQIAGSEPAQLATAARACVDRGAQIIDINMGCPAKKVCRKAAGSALLRDEQLVARILETVVAAVDVPVTLKYRTGWDREHRNAVRIGRIAEQAGVTALAIHGRTRADRFRGAAEYETIARVKEIVSIPVIANGDITTIEKSLEVLRLTNADGLMIGRGAQGRPWIFRELLTLVDPTAETTQLGIDDLRAIMLGHLDELHRFYGESTGVRVARKHLTWYCENLANADEFRYRVVRVGSAQEQIRLTEQFFSGMDQSGTEEDHEIEIHDQQEAALQAR